MPSQDSKAIARLDQMRPDKAGTRNAIQQHAGSANPVVLIEQSRAMLAQAKDITDLRRVMAAASVGGDIARQQARLTEDTESARQAALVAIEADALRLEAEASAGEMLKLMRVNGERAKGGEQLRQPELQAATLEDLGVSKTESSRWQKLASVPAEQRLQYIASVRETRGDVSRAALLRLTSATVKHEQRPKSTPVPEMMQPAWAEFERQYMFWIEHDPNRLRELVIRHRPPDPMHLDDWRWKQQPVTKEDQVGKRKS